MIASIKASEETATPASISKHGGLLVVLEGIDGSGKGTILKLLQEFLEFRGETVTTTRDPGGTDAGELIRQTLFKILPEAVPGVDSCLFHASHLQNWHTKVRPALDAGHVVLADRWYYSALAYYSIKSTPEILKQAYTREHGDDADLLIFLMSSDIERAFDRANGREDAVSHQQHKPWNDAAKQAVVQGEFIRLFSGLPSWFEVDTSALTPEQVFEEIKPRLLWALENKRRQSGD